MSTRLLLAAGLTFAAGCGQRMTPQRLLEMNIDVVAHGAVQAATRYLYRVSQVLVREPAWTGQTAGFDVASIAERRAFWTALFAEETIRDWLLDHYRAGLRMEVADLREFRTLAELVRGIGSDPYEQGILIPRVLRERYADAAYRDLKPARVGFIPSLASTFFAATLVPEIERRRAVGEDCSIPKLLEVTGIVDRWAVGYVLVGDRLEATLLLRVRGCWLLWPVLTGGGSPAVPD